MAADSSESPLDSMGLVVMPEAEVVEPVDAEPEIAQGGGEAPALMPEAMVVVSTASNAKQKLRFWGKSTQKPLVINNICQCHFETYTKMRFVNFLAILE